MILLPLLLAAQSLGGDGNDLALATAPAILVGARACLGSTVDTGGTDARLAGWVDASSPVAGIGAVGRIVTRDNVVVVVQPGIEGVCVVKAEAAARFDRAAFLTALAAVVGTKVAIDPNGSATVLKNGELLMTKIGNENGKTGVELSFVNQKGKQAHIQGK